MIWKWLKHTKIFIGKCRKDNIGAFASQAAFFVLLSFITFLIVLSSMLKYTFV